MAPTILFCDLTQTADRQLTTQLAHCGFIVRTAADVNAALEQLLKDPPALVLLRIADGSAARECRSFRAVSRVPIVVICTRRSEELVIACLREGADAVLAALPSRRELEARIAALLSARDRKPAPVARPALRRIGDLAIDARMRIVSKDGNIVSLTPTEYRLLIALAQRRGSIATREELLSEVWGATRKENAEALRHYVRYLRLKLGDALDRPRLIQNQRGVGYRLVEHVA